MLCATSVQSEWASESKRSNCWYLSRARLLSLSLSVSVCTVFFSAFDISPSLISYDLDSLLHILRAITFNALMPCADRFIIIHLHLYTHTRSQKDTHSQSHTHACSHVQHSEFNSTILDIGHANQHNHMHMYNVVILLIRKTQALCDWMKWISFGFFVRREKKSILITMHSNGRGNCDLYWSHFLLNDFFFFNWWTIRSCSYTSVFGGFLFVGKEI